MTWDLTSLSGTHEVVGAAPVSNGPWNYAFNFCENVDTSPAAVCVTPVTAPTSAYRVEDYPINVQCDNLGAPPRSAAACWSCVPLLRVDRGATSLSPAPASVCMLADRYTRLMRCEPPPRDACRLPACLSASCAQGRIWKALGPCKCRNWRLGLASQSPLLVLVVRVAGVVWWCRCCVMNRSRVQIRCPLRRLGICHLSSSSGGLSLPARHTKTQDSLSGA